VSTNPKAMKLTAQMEYRNVPGTGELMEVVTVRFGQIDVLTLPPCRTSKASHGDDSSYFRQEQEDIVAETVAPVLTRMFAAAMVES
jgi:hypothetical protein